MRLDEFLTEGGGGHWKIARCELGEKVKELGDKVGSESSNKRENVSYF